MGEVTRQESVAAVTFGPQDLQLTEARRRDACRVAKEVGMRQCGDKKVCQMEARLGAAAVTYRCQKVGCPNPAAVGWAANYAINSLAYLVTNPK